jgi:D-alanyl-D-alanine carboxypeptidase/D-alanyl-D-alanine-endopeptidase (penicillin-binding protein 4)
MIAAAIIAALLLAGCSSAPQPVLFVPPPAFTSAEPQAPVRELDRDLDKLLADPVLQRGIWGILVKSLTSNDTLFAVNPRRLLLPGSNVKIATLAAAAEQLGWEYSYETRLLGVGQIQLGVLDGDLLVVGSGDPSIDDWDGAATRLFQEWADQLKAKGITSVNGRLVGDDNSFDDEPLGSGWAWDDLDSSFATGVGALQFNQNTARLTITPGAAVGEAANITVAGPGAPLGVSNQMITSAAGVPPSIITRRLPGSSLIVVTGSIPVGSEAAFRNVSVDNPTLYFINQLRDALVANGIDISGPAIDIDELSDPPNREDGVLLLTHKSPPLSTLATTMMKMSQNLYAETLLKTLGGSAQPATTEAGRKSVQTVLTGWQINSADIVIADGSGLSRYNLATPEALVAILTRAARDARVKGSYEATLPVAGRDGTLEFRMRGTAAEDNAHAKTGSLSNVRVISGYVRSSDGEPLVFSIIANNFGAQAANAVEATEDAIIVRLAEFSRKR